VLAGVAAVHAPSAEASVSEVAREHRGHCLAPVDDGPLLVAFASAHDGLDAARGLAGTLDARVSAVTGQAEPRAGGYRGEPASSAARLLALAGPRQVVLDHSTAETIDGRLPPDVGLAALDPDLWALVAPGLAVPERAVACPYRGLMAFGSQDSDLFFGREDVVASMLDRLLDTGFLAVVGASGSGKSSLVRAGLVPAVRAARDGSVAMLTPGLDPVGELARSLEAGTPALLVVDQFEELFTLCPDEARRARFVDDVLELGESSAVSIVVVLRADFYGHCANHPRLAAAVAEQQLLLGAMQTDELRRAIESPARAAGLRLEAGLVDSMLADVEGEPGALPLLSHALYETWAHREGRVLTFAGYRVAGGVRGAIAHTAEQVFTGCSPEEQTLMRELLLRLTELGEGTEDTRRRVPLPELSGGESDAAASAVLEKLAVSRLLVVGDDSAEIAHEALIREWPRLRGWLTEDREGLRVLRQLGVATRAWEENGRDEAYLYRGARLEAASERAGDAPQLAPVEREFLQASSEAQELELVSANRRARRLRALLAVVAVALVVALIAGAFALVQRGSARRTATVAQAGRLAAQSREVAAEQPDLGLLLALEAGRLDDSVDSRSALVAALGHGSRIHAWLQGFEWPVNASAFSPDGRLLATVTQDGTTLWDTTTWRPTGAPLRSPQGASGDADFSPDGRTLAIAGAKGRVELWDVSTRTKRRDLTDPAAVSFGDPSLATVKFSPDGSVVAAGGLEANHVTLWDAVAGRLLGRPITTNPPGGGAQSISFSPDSKRIAVPGGRGTVGIWEVATGRRTGAPLVAGDADVDAAIFADGGRTLITSDDSGAVSTLDAESGRRLGPPLSVGNQAADSLTLSPDGRLLAAASFDGTVFVWDRPTRTLYGPPLRADASPVNDVVFGPDGRTLSSSHLRSAVAWDMTAARALGEPLGEANDVISTVAFAPDGEWLVAGRLDGDTVVFDTSTRRPTARIAGDSIVSAVAVHPGGKLVALGTVDGQVRLFDPKIGSAVGAPLVERGPPVWDLDFSPDGGLLAAAVDPNGSGEGLFLQQRQGEALLWDVESRRRVGRAIVPGGGSVLSLAFDPDGELLATGSYRGRLDLWDVATQVRHGEPMRVADDGVLSVGFDPSGRLVAAGGAIGPVRVWRVEDGRPAFPPLSGHTGYVTGVSFDSTGSLLASTSIFGDTKLWDPATGLAYGDELVSDRPESLEPTVKLPYLGLRNAFSPDGTLLATPGVDGHAMLWTTEPVAWRERACAIAGRNLTREEWDLYLPAAEDYRATCSEWPSG
jgi:WD40 repeat protein